MRNRGIYRIKIYEGFRSDDEQFQRFLKKERKELKLFNINFSVEIVGGGVLESVGRRDLNWVVFSIIGVRRDGLSILDRGGRRDLI